MRVAEDGTEVIPVWNKSNREHIIVNSVPASVQAAGRAAVNKLGWTKAWHVDADHIRLDTVDRFIPHSDFFTVDVADSIGRTAAPKDIKTFIDRHPELVGRLEISGMESFLPTRVDVERIAAKYLYAVKEVASIHNYIVKAKGTDQFITEASMDETDQPQTPLELLVILVALADERVPVQTIAPKFTGRFNKGVDYVGEVSQFEREFNQDLAVIAFATKKYKLPENLKLSIHCGSDKFSLYGVMRLAMQRFNAGLHLKTSGTTWLEEIIGLAESGGEGLALAKTIYDESFEHLDELSAPYAAVLDINPTRLPKPEFVSNWSSEQFVAALRHDPGCKDYNRHLRQLLHIGFKIASLRGERFLAMVRQCSGPISKNVTDNLYRRHFKPLFSGL